MTESIVSKRYLDGEYARANPHWDAEDAPWKASKVRSLLDRQGVAPESIAEVGCGSGAVLAELRRAYPDAELAGFDIAPGAEEHWRRHADYHIRFTLGDFLESEDRFDVILLLDVIEHLENPFDFLCRIRSRADLFAFHVPLDLSAMSVLREKSLLFVRDKVGHIHYYTKGLALALLGECGYEIIEARYTGAAFSAPQRTIKTRLAGLFRRTARLLGEDVAVRLLGGETLLVLARPAPVR